MSIIAMLLPCSENEEAHSTEVEALRQEVKFHKCKSNNQIKALIDKAIKATAQAYDIECQKVAAATCVEWAIKIKELKGRLDMIQLEKSTLEKRLS
ncbi:hypothetical protein ACH5RR_001638 [Cinchona calisaya]|uniref:Uncharacterized protein n=1 Tax=Cinchona calisaya TaxID=153742 RepID=A0ABD3B571_9GENT